MDRTPSFEDFLVKRNEDLDNAAHGLALLLLSANATPPSENEFPWNMEIIGAILESVEHILERHGYPTCWPYHENEIPCTDAGGCKNKHCPLQCGQQKEAMTNE